MTVLVLVVALVLPVVASAFSYDPATLQSGTVKQPANGTTVISVQGFKIAGEDSGKKPARLVGVGPNGELKWEYNGSKNGIVWFYDVDPLDNGTLLITGTKPGQTVVSIWNPKTRETEWSRTFDWEDTHDVDLVNGDQLLVANMRNYDGMTEKNNDRLLLYDISDSEVVWEWKFRNHGFNRSGGGDYTDDWTHVNDVDKVGSGQYIASPRNFDQVIRVNRTSKSVTMQVGSDENHSVMYEQHNPQFLRGENGTPTMLVADSENDRIVEYAKVDGDWRRTWTLRGEFNWPRDADRLPNGNTLVTDTLNHRVMEVTPEGEVVWEFYAPWGTYDAERVRWGDEAGGPTIREQNATGAVTLSGSEKLMGERQTFSQWVAQSFAGTPISEEAAWFAARWSHITPWMRPVWMSSWGLVRSLLAGLLTIGWLVGELTLRRNRVRRKAGQILNQ
ncbi:MAG: aryl-sulfate sulfotransferase [Halolamina sp.]